jgi:hypothetical protein
MHRTKRSRIIVQCTMNIRPTKLEQSRGDGVATVRTNQVGAVTPQTREAPWVQVEAGIDLIIARRASKLQHSHNYPLRSLSKSSRLGRSPR